jgi:hypothetical protein
MKFDPLDTLGPVFTPDPVVRAHPLNRGRRAWWLALPSLAGGRTWYDLMRRAPAALLNMTAAGTGWGGTTQPGGWGRVRCNGVTGHVDTGVSIADLAPAAGTIAWWMRPEVAYDDGGIHYPLRQDDGSPLWDCQKYADNSVYVGFYSPFDYRINFMADAANWPLNGWVRWAFAWTGDQPAKLYVDGGKLVYTAAAATPAGIAPAGTLRIGAGAGGPNLAASYNSVSVWDRELSAAEARSEYELERTGLPGVLRRWPRAMAAAGGPAVAPLASYFRRRRTA